MEKGIFLRRFPLFLKFPKGFYEEPPILEAFSPFFLSSSRGFMGSRLSLRRFPLYLKLLNGFYGKPPIFEAFPSHRYASQGLL